MKISLISPYTDVTAIGVRILSAVLRQAGHETQLIMLPDAFRDKTVCRDAPHYNQKIIRQLSELCRGSGLVGISLMTNFFAHAIEITTGLREVLQIPIIWGGVHPTVRPEECLEYADMVCIGEGEDALVTLVNRLEKNEPYTDIPGICYTLDGQMAKNPVQSPEPNIDRFPFPDYSMKDHHILSENMIVPMTNEIIKKKLQREALFERLGFIGYQTMTSRGCPFACTYCINDMLNRMYGNKKKLRWRSVDNLIEELILVRKQMPHVNFIRFSDDEFFARKPEELAYFAVEYKKKIDLPFSCLLSPMSVTRDKMAMMVDAGLVLVQMGVQSGSEKMQRLFNRKMMHNQRMMQTMQIINEFKEKIYPPSYDFILDVPEETDEDILDSLRFISKIPKPYRLNVFGLIPYPGTQMYNLAKQQGLIRNEQDQIYRRFFAMRKINYFNLLFAFCRMGRCPHFLLKLLISRPAIFLFNNRIFLPCIRLFYTSGKKIRPQTS
ncbi:MAG: radical SAM protein [Candidatus Electrothrix sp. GW3-4]|uniref:B12-binding domain-containing radical SAM protein n=1 Tax=Candidatus Electrothrix sp. GW3-4 TaxID=3126740 RepID=UPI0030CD8193